MSYTDEEIKEIKRDIYKSRKELEYAKTKLDNNIFNYIYMRTRNTKYIKGVFDTLREYLVEYHSVPESDALEMFATFRKDITFGPITERLYRIDKHNNTIWYDTIVYGWGASHIAYVRADETSDGFQHDCTYYNGIDMRDFENYEYPSWWKTTHSYEDDPKKWYKIKTTLETYITNSTSEAVTSLGHVSNIMDELRSLPPEIRLIRILFDMKEGFHYLLRNEENIESVSYFVKGIDVDSESDDDKSDDSESEYEF
jgi:hypothetical protein